MRILGTYHCGKECREEFKRHIKNHDVLCWNDNTDRIVSSFAHQIKSEYYGVNRSVSIEGIALGHFSASNQASS